MNPSDSPSDTPETTKVQEVQETWFTVREVVDATRLSLSTVKRRLSDEVFPNARQSDGSDGRVSGTWLIPKRDLLANGLRLYAPSPANEGQEVIDLDHDSELEASDPLADMKRELEELKRQRDEERHKKELAEAVAAERQQALEMMNQAMRMLDAGPRPTPEPVIEPPKKNQKRFWQRS